MSRAEEPGPTRAGSMRAGPTGDASAGPDSAEGRLPRWLVIAGRVIAGSFALVTGGIYLLLLISMFRAYVGPPRVDPHGYTIIFGTFLAWIPGVAAAISAPFAFPPEHRQRAHNTGQWIVVVITIGLIAIFVAG